MDKQKMFRTLVLPLLVTIFAWINFTRLTGSENVRTLHIISLLTVGVGIGVLLRNTIAYYTGK